MRHLPVSSVTFGYRAPVLKDPHAALRFPDTDRPSVSLPPLATLGKSPKADVVVDDDTVSRLHASFEQVGLARVVTDLGSRNGTFVNGARVVTRVLHDGDELRVGRTRLHFNAPRAGDGGVALAPGAVAVRASRPAARPTLAILKLFLGSANATCSCHRLSGVLNPADEFVPRERRDVLPSVERRGVGDQRVPQVCWKLVHHPTGYSRGTHRRTVSVRGQRYKKCHRLPVEFAQPVVGQMNLLNALCTKGTTTYDVPPGPVARRGSRRPTQFGHANRSPATDSVPKRQRLSRRVSFIATPPR